MSRGDGVARSAECLFSSSAANESLAIEKTKQRSCDDMLNGKIYNTYHIGNSAVGGKEKQQQITETHTNLTDSQMNLGRLKKEDRSEI